MTVTDIGGGWTATTDHAQSSYGIPVYLRGGGGAAHSLAEALAAGMLRDVRGARGHSQPEAARRIGVSTQSVHRWETSKTAPTILAQRALVGYLARGEI